MQSSPELKRPEKSPNLYQKSLPLMIDILKRLNKDKPQYLIARELGISKSRVSYFVSKAKSFEFVKEKIKDVITLYELTPSGLDFLVWYQERTWFIRAEKIQFKAKIMQMPRIELLERSWKKVDMHNWVQFHQQIENIEVKLNFGDDPSVVFIPPPRDGDDPFSIFGQMLYDCDTVGKLLEAQYQMKIGRLNLSPRGEWLVYDPVAKAFSKQFGQINYEGLAKINASKPRSIGEFEFPDPRTLVDYLEMPKRIEELNEKIDRIEDWLKTKD